MSTRSCSRTAPLRLAAAALVLVGLGCQREAESPESHAAKTAVARYNQALVEAFTSGDQERLATVATEAERSRVGAIIAGLRRNGQVMFARQTSQRTTDVTQVKPELFQITTRETWEYEHRPLAAPQTPVPSKVLTYVMEYQVRQQEGAWVVQHALAREELPGATPR